MARTTDHKDQNPMIYVFISNGSRVALSVPQALPSVRALCAALIFLLFQQHANAGLMLYPTRIVFDKNVRAAQLELINNGTDTATYRISLVNRRMGDSGEFTPADIAAPGEPFADDLLRFSPRQITLAPGVAQTVRIMLRKPAGLPVGEYRSHLQFDKLPEAKGGTSIEAQGSADGKDIGIALTALIGVSVPVIVRHGDTSASVGLSHLALPAPGPDHVQFLALQLDRSGNRSVYGDLIVGFTPQGGAERIIGKAGGVALYAANALRRAKLVLQPAAGVSLTHGRLRVIYSEPAEAGGKVLAEAFLTLP